MKDITPQAITDAFAAYRGWQEEMTPTAGMSTQDKRTMLRWQIEGIQSGSEDDEGAASFRDFADSLGLGDEARGTLYREIDKSSMGIDPLPATVTGVLIGLILAGATPR